MLKKRQKRYWCRSQKCGGGGEAATAATGGPRGQDSCIVSLHAPVAAVTPALCLGPSAGNVWFLDTASQRVETPGVSEFSKPLPYSSKEKQKVGGMTKIIKAGLY